MSKHQVPQPPTPIHKNRPLAQPKPDRNKPLTDALMTRVKFILDSSEGKHSRSSLAKEIGKTPQEVVEWLAGYRSSPNCEMTIKLLAWAEKNG